MNTPPPQPEQVPAPGQMTRTEFRRFVEAQTNPHNTANPPLSIGDYNIPQHIHIQDRSYHFWYRSTGRRGHSMGMSNQLFLTGPGIPPGTKTTAHGSQDNHDATFVLRHIHRAEKQFALHHLPAEPRER